MKLLGHSSTCTSSAPVALSPSRRPCGKLSLTSCSLKLSSSSKHVLACDLVPASRAENHTKRAEAPKHRQGLSDQLKLPLTLHELLQRAKISPILVNGDVNVLITGIQHDSGLVTRGNVFVCCRGFSTDGHVHSVKIPTPFYQLCPRHFMNIPLTSLLLLALPVPMARLPPLT
ncbi:hypothetical protein L7F22_011308 [Adiantum nelumboides]|nr:hypothetical protein [Adiantum nelumboides]